MFNIGTEATEGVLEGVLSGGWVRVIMWFGKG